jgi:uncharacterized OB-fold protein
MPAKRYLADYVSEMDFDPAGIDATKFDSAKADDYIQINCASCGRKFATKKRDLVQRFRRSSVDSKVSRCLSCVNADNRKSK